MLYLILILIFVCTFVTVYQTTQQASLRQQFLQHMPEEPLFKTKGKKKKNIIFMQILNLFTPLTQNLSAKMKTKGIYRRLIMAGSPLNIPQFFAFKLLTLILTPLTIYILFKLKIKLLLLSILIGFFIPDLWLRQKIVKRHRGIRRDLPNVIDLLNLCVGGGLDFMLAVNRVIKTFETCPLIEELQLFWHENMIGKPRREALKNLAWRVNLPELSSFVRTMIQADRMGTPVSEALIIQAEEIRIRRFQRGEEMALKAPIKLLFPLLFFILPVVLIIVGGPVLLQFMRGGIKFF